MAYDIKTWDLVVYGPHITTKNLKKRCLIKEVPKCIREYDETDRTKEKSVALKVSQNYASEDEKDMNYLTEIFQKIFKKMVGFKKKETPTK